MESNSRDKTAPNDVKLREYDPAWTDEELMAWDGNFKDDGAWMLICSERDVEAAMGYRNRVRG